MTQGPTVVAGFDDKPPPLIFDEITVLYLHFDGAFAGYFFHPNPAAMTAKAAECAEKFPEYQQTIATYRRV